MIEQDTELPPPPPQPPIRQQSRQSSQGGANIAGGASGYSSTYGGRKGQSEYQHRDSKIGSSSKHSHSNTPYTEGGNSSRLIEEDRKKKELKERRKSEDRSENHWVLRLGLEGKTKESITNSMNELKKINEIIASSSEKRLKLEMEVAKLDRLSKNEELRCKLADEKLEAMDFV
ncbi:unnamed protein product [Ambrosiozyma monospora]|uniref:Unnamed protein product n=1 Tax=Ambrosiozyma monospora TaxID=43982 RepID=A0ACB5U6K7_AMBMO|nr:unnamed protein product [Ambrosiozyma monospora]